MPVAQNNSPICPILVSLERDGMRRELLGTLDLPEALPEDQVGIKWGKNGLFIGFSEDRRVRRHMVHFLLKGRNGLSFRVKKEKS